jgi:Holliday junction resolvasome RuvABC endonuclease subunit
MLSLGLDPSLRGFGWAIHDNGATGKARLVDRGLWATSPKEIFVVRYMTLRELLSDLLKKNPEITWVGVESPPFGEQFSEGLYALFTYVNEAVYLARRDVVHFDPGTVKMLAKVDPALRPGKMFKSDMVDMARLDTTVQKWNHNEADAYLIALYSSRFWQFQGGTLPLTELTPSEYKAFARVDTFVRGAKKGLTVNKGAVYKENRRFFRFSQIP